MIRKFLAIMAGILVLAAVAVALVVSRYDFNRLKAPVADAVRKATGRELTLDGDIHLAPGLRPALTAKGLSLANPDWGSRSEMIRLGYLEVQVALIPLLRGRLEVERFTLIEPDILLETDAKGRSNFDFTGAAADKPGAAGSRGEKAPAVLPALALKALEIRNGRLVYREGASGRTYQVALEQVRAGMADMAGPLEIFMAGAYGNQAFTLDGRVGPLSSALDPAVAWPVALQVKAKDIVVRLNGRIQNVMDRRGIDVDFRLQTSDLNRAASLVELSQVGPVPMELSGNIKDSGPKGYRISDLELKLGQSDLSGTIAVDLTPQRPGILADLASKRIDLVTLMPSAGIRQARPPADASASVAPSSGQRLFSQAPLPIGGLSAVNATVALKVDRIELPEIALDRLETKLTLAGGRMVVAPFAAIIADGVLTGELTLTGRAKTVDLAARMAVGRLDLGKLFTEMKATDTFEGVADADLALKSSGASVAALMAGLNGHLRLVMENARIGKGLADLIGGDIAAGVLGLIDPTARHPAHTAINCCVVRLDAVNGLADTTVLLVDTPRIAVVGDGRIDLRNEQLDIALEGIPKEGLSSGKTGQLRTSLSELLRPLKLHGPLSDPSLAIDPTRMAMSLETTIRGLGLLRQTGVTTSNRVGAGGSEEGKDPCPAALEAARKGLKFNPAQAPVPPPRPGTAKAPASASPLEQMGNTLIKDLFGN